LTKDDIAAVKFLNGSPTMTGTDTQQDPDTGRPVVCQYFGQTGGASPKVVAVVSIIGESEYNTIDKNAIGDPPVVLPRIGQQAKLVMAAPGAYEVWVHSAHGFFKVFSLSKEASTALASAAVTRS
jgi:hypothetical protein